MGKYIEMPKQGNLLSIGNVFELIGNTPLIKVGKNNIYAKAEYLNPGGSIKDRVALSMILDAEKKGELRKGMTIVEPSSGNTGIGIALIGKLLGYEVIIVMPENMSYERKKIIEHFGAKIILTPKDESIAGSVRKAFALKEANKNVYIPNQFENTSNVEVHYRKTAVELSAQLCKKIDFFVSGIGSGGTIQGVGAFLKHNVPHARIIAVEPKNCSAILGHEPGLHKIQGIGDGFIPKILDVSIIDEVIEVTDEDAIDTSRELAKKYGLLVGISAGANVWACLQIQKKYEKAVISTILPDRGERYFSTSLYTE
jgi:cysteine synthase A